MKIELNHEEIDTIWKALAIAHEVRTNLKQTKEIERISDLLFILSIADSITIELDKVGTTEEGRKILQEFLSKREGDKSNVIIFPESKIIKEE